MGRIEIPDKAVVDHVRYLEILGQEVKEEMERVQDMVEREERESKVESNKIIGPCDFKKQKRYCNRDGSRDLIDRWADEKSVEEFRAIMIGQIEKYCSRYGKKDDVINEVRKIVDYGQRLLAYEMKLPERGE